MYFPVVLLLVCIFLFLLEDLLSAFHAVSYRSGDAELPQFLSGKAYISPSYMKSNFARLSILGWQVLSFNILNMSFHCLLAYRVSPDKSADSLMRVTL